MRRSTRIASLKAAHHDPEADEGVPPADSEADSESESGSDSESDSKSDSERELEVLPAHLEDPMNINENSMNIDEDSININEHSMNINEDFMNIDECSMNIEEHSMNIDQTSSDPFVASKDAKIIPGHQYKRTSKWCRMLAAHLRCQLRDAKIITVEYDLALAFFLYETDHLNIGDIPDSLDVIRDDFNKARRSTGRQWQLLICTLHIQISLKRYELRLFTDPDAPMPLALRYPNLKALKVLVEGRAKNPKVLPDDKAVILLDVAGRAMAVGIPPRKDKKSEHSTTVGIPCEKDEKPKHPTGEDRALQALESAANVYQFKEITDDMINGINKSKSKSKPKSKSKSKSKAQSKSKSESKPKSTVSRFFDFVTSKVARLTRACSKPIDCLGALHGTIMFQTYGYGRGAKHSKGMIDKQMKLGDNRQGHPSTRPTWEAQRITDANLVRTIQMGEETATKRAENDQLTHELLWQYETSRLINLSFQPETYHTALLGIDLIAQNSPSLVQTRIEAMRNRGVPGRQITFNNQVPYHRDQYNSMQLDSNFTLGRNFLGGGMVIADAGYQFPGYHGYSVHAAFKILTHGVQPIRPNPQVDALPLRISLALYSHADVFDGVARFSAALNGGESYSDESLWLPFFPVDCDFEKVCARLRKEEDLMMNEENAKSAAYQAEQKRKAEHNQAKHK